MQLSVYTLFFVLMCIVYSCKGESQKRDHVTEKYLGAFKKEIPKFPDGRPTNVYRFVDTMSNWLSIDKLDSGFSQTQIRIWYSYDVDSIGQVIILKEQNDKWVGEIIKYKFVWDNLDQKISCVDSINHFLLSPYSGWGKFTKNLYSLRIKDLPDMESISGNRYDITHGNSYTVEVATESSYRIYSYTASKKIENEFEEAKSMRKILELLEREFSSSTVGSL